MANYNIILNKTVLVMLPDWWTAQRSPDNQGSTVPIGNFNNQVAKRLEHTSGGQFYELNLFFRWTL